MKHLASRSRALGRRVLATFGVLASVAALARHLAECGAAPAAAPELASRFKLLGVMASKQGDAGYALIAVDAKPARAYAVGAPLDGNLVLQSVSLRKAEIGPAQGSAALTLEVPALPTAATGTLPSAADGLKFGAAAAARAVGEVGEVAGRALGAQAPGVEAREHPVGDLGHAARHQGGAGAEVAADEARVAPWRPPRAARAPSCPLAS